MRLEGSAPSRARRRGHVARDARGCRARASLRRAHRTSPRVPLTADLRNFEMLLLLSHARLRPSWPHSPPRRSQTSRTSEVAGAWRRRTERRNAAGGCTGRSRAAVDVGATSRQRIRGSDWSPVLTGEACEERCGGVAVRYVSNRRCFLSGLKYTYKKLVATREDRRFDRRGPGQALQASALDGADPRAVLAPVHPPPQRTELPPRQR